MGKREDKIINATCKQLMKDGKYEKDNVQSWFNFKERIGCWYQPKDATQELKDMIEYVVSNEQFDIAIAFKLALEELEQYFIDEDIDPQIIYN